jgi:hypothetical protein
MYTTTQYQLPRGDRLFGRRRKSTLLDPMGYPIEIYGGISLAIDATNCLSTKKNLIATRKASHARIDEPFLRKEFRDGSLTTLEACFGLSIARPRLLTFVSTSGGLAQARATTTTEAFLLRDS